MYFQNITSLGELKRQYRKLAMANHPDRGGSEDAMKAINAEFEKLFAVWETRTTAANDCSGYADDFASATAQEYTSYVYNEFKFEGSNWKTHHELSNKKICEYVRTWLKERYPAYEWRVNKSGYNSVNVRLMKADFYPLVDRTKGYCEVSKYRCFEDSDLTERGREVFQNVIEYVQSWNFDDSDAMTDYFHVNFYATFSVGDYGKSFVFEPLSLKGKGKVFVRHAGPVERAVKAAMGQGNRFDYNKVYNRDKNEYEPETDKPKVLVRDDETGWPLWYSQPSLVKSRIAKLAEVGITARPSKRGIELVCYSDELLAKLEAEKAAEDERERAFYAGERRQSTTLPQNAENSPEGVQIIDYSDKAFAIVGDTRKYANAFKLIGGRYNPKLKCGAGWIFSKRHFDAIKSAMA